QIDVQGRVPGGDGEIGKRRVHVDRRYVDQDVEPAERVDHRSDQGRCSLRLRQVDLEGGGAPTRRAHRLDRLIRFSARPRVAHRDVDAARREIAGDDQADA